MESVIAVEGDGFVVVAADVTNARSIVVMKEDMDKIVSLDSHKLFAAAGMPGDVSKFTEHVQRDVRLYNLRSGIPMTMSAVANFTRGQLARFLRRSPMQCNVLLAGYDENVGASLYSCDYLGTLHKLTCAAEGYAQYFVLSTMDRYWKKNMTRDEALALVQRCIQEVQQRLLINQPRFCVKIVGKDGVEVVTRADVATPGKKTPEAVLAEQAATV